MKKENAINEVNDELLYDEDLETYFEVIDNVVKITEVAGQKKTKSATPILFKGDKPKCEGKYKVVDGKKYLYVTCQGKEGFVPEKALVKL